MTAGNGRPVRSWAGLGGWRVGAISLCPLVEEGGGAGVAEGV